MPSAPVQCVVCNTAGEEEKAHGGKYSKRQDWHDQQQVSHDKHQGRWAMTKLH